MDTRVAAFITDLEAADPAKAGLVRAVRALYLDTQPALREQFIYGGIGFFRDEELIGGVFAYANHVTAEFSLGSGLDDPDRLLEGKGKSRRHLKLRDSNDVETKNVGFFVRQVVAG